MRILAEAKLQEIADGLAVIGEVIQHTDLRPPESGLVMLRGRIGGDGAPFNVGEATVTRCAVQLQSGQVGFSYALGRDRHKARLAAVCDALWQSDEHREAVERHVLSPVRMRIDAERTENECRTAATRVDFFTMVRGED
ncbi:phosphonate C-P lyase system protein PhnG [Pseudorhodoplanes sinuspersici]|nr:phosphonate C-P lyase system protein PhnG [Pseudorhodoplanes sinuspersici]